MRFGLVFAIIRVRNCECRWYRCMSPTISKSHSNSWYSSHLNKLGVINSSFSFLSSQSQRTLTFSSFYWLALRKPHRNLASRPISSILLIQQVGYSVTIMAVPSIFWCRIWTSLGKELKGMYASPQNSSLSSSHSQMSLISSETCMRVCLEVFSGGGCSFLAGWCSWKRFSKSLSRLILRRDSLRRVRLMDWSSWKCRFSLMTSASSWEELGLRFSCSSIMISNQFQLKLIVRSGYFVMEIGQSRSSARGPLIAVIKIEIDAQRTDRIFLHLRDNDLRLAELFVQKHRLTPALVHHIHQRIKFSRQSVQGNDQVPATPHGVQQGVSTPYSHNNYKLETPINNLTDNHCPYTEDQSFGNTNLFSDRYTQHEEHVQKAQQEREVWLSGPRTIAPKDQLPAPSKKDVMRSKEFVIYDKQNSQDDENIQVNLFGTTKANPPRQATSPEKESSDTIREKNVRNTEKKGRNALEIIRQQQNQNIPLRQSRSMMKLSQRKDPVQIQDIFRKISKPQTTKAIGSGYDKPSHVKILKKEEIESLNQSMKKSMSKQEISRINKDVTKRLYNEANLKKNYLHIIKEKAKKDKEMEEDHELTLKPQINKVSRVIAEGRRKNDVPIEDYLIEVGRKAATKKAECNSQKLINELENCTFKPALNLITQKLAADKEYLQSRLKQHSRRKSRYKDENTFRPSLNKITHELMKGKGSFQDRQKLYLETKNEKLMDRVHERMLAERIDLATGQQLFKPVINDLGVRESQGANIGAYLYKMGREVAENTDGDLGHPRISETSQSMVQQMYTRRITWLFGELDSDQDGVISAHKICIDTISPEILQIIKPILFQMEQIREQLTLLEFKNAVDILHRKLNVNEKHILYNYKQKCK